MTDQLARMFASSLQGYLLAELPAYPQFLEYLLIVGLMAGNEYAYGLAMALHFDEFFAGRTVV